MTNISVVDEYHQAMITEGYAQIFPSHFGFGRTPEDEESNDPQVKVVRKPRKAAPKATEVAETKEVEEAE